MRKKFFINLFIKLLYTGKVYNLKASSLLDVFYYAERVGAPILQNQAFKDIGEHFATMGIITLDYIQIQEVWDSVILSPGEQE